MIEIPQEWMKETNCEIARRLNVSPTAVMYARRRLLGKCLRCKRKAEPGTQHCPKHRKAINAAKRQRKGHKPWRPGGRGRPPVVRQQERTAA